MEWLTEHWYWIVIGMIAVPTIADILGWYFDKLAAKQPFPDD